MAQIFTRSRSIAASSIFDPPSAAASSTILAASKHCSKSRRIPAHRFSRRNQRGGSGKESPGPPTTERASHSSSGRTTIIMPSTRYLQTRHTPQLELRKLRLDQHRLRLTAIADQPLRIHPFLFRKDGPEIWHQSVQRSRKFQGSRASSSRTISASRSTACPTTTGVTKFAYCIGATLMPAARTQGPALAEIIERNCLCGSNSIRPADARPWEERLKETSSKNQLC